MINPTSEVKSNWYEPKFMMSNNLTGVYLLLTMDTEQKEGVLVKKYLWLSYFSFLTTI